MKIKLIRKNEVLVEGIVRKRDEEFDISEEVGESLVASGKFEAVDKKTTIEKKGTKENGIDID